MKRQAVLLLCAGFMSAGFLAAGDTPEKKALQKEWAKLEGTWIVVAQESNGVKSDDDDVKTLGKVTLKDGKYTWDSGSGGTMVIDPTKKPKHVDYAIVDGLGIVHTYLGIYELDGDTFRDCYAPPDMARPTEFKTAPNSGHVTMVHKREKVEKEQ
ncbi:MAG: TIGR03067 domain-containing protein [Planctomycetes bacterium]|nr:TIGR03067 domain-containing protein [Planctomycetota bacterium]